MTRSIGSVLFLSVMSLFNFSARAQDLYVINGTVHSVAGPAVQADILIRDGRIQRIADRLNPDDSDSIIDASGMLVTPGFIDFDTQMGLVEIWAVEESRDTNAGGEDAVRSAFRAADAINPQSIVVDISRRGGVTSALSHPDGGLIAGQSAWLDLNGERPKDVIVQAPITMVMQGGASGGNASGGSRASALMYYRELFTDVMAMLEDPRAYAEGSMRDLSLSYLDMLELAQVLSGEVPVYLSANRSSDILNALGLASEFGLSVILRGGAEAWLVADELAIHQIPVVVNPMRNAPYNFEQLGSRADTAHLLDQAGVPVIIAGDTQFASSSPVCR